MSLPACPYRHHQACLAMAWHWEVWEHSDSGEPLFWKTSNVMPTCPFLCNSELCPEGWR